MNHMLTSFKQDKLFKIFVLSDGGQEATSRKLTQFLEGYHNYELHYVSNTIDLDILMNEHPDIIIMGDEFSNVVKCYESVAA